MTMNLIDVNLALDCPIHCLLEMSRDLLPLKDRLYTPRMVLAAPITEIHYVIRIVKCIQYVYSVLVESIMFY